MEEQHEEIEETEVSNQLMPLLISTQSAGLENDAANNVDVNRTVTQNDSDIGGTESIEHQNDDSVQ